VLHCWRRFGASKRLRMIRAGLSTIEYDQVDNAAELEARPIEATSGLSRTVLSGRADQRKDQRNHRYEEAGRAPRAWCPG